MNAQEYNLNIRPGYGYSQTVKVSQDDIGRPLEFHLYDGMDLLSITVGSVITIHATKPSGLGFTETCTWSGSTASISTTESMTQESGAFPAELVITSGGDVLGTANFTFCVERSPHQTGTTDGVAEDLQDIYEQLDDLKEEISELGGLSDDVKAALLQIAAKAEYIDEGGPTYYQDLYDALYPPAQTYTVTNTLTGCTTNNAAASVTENAPYSATITASSGYSLTGATVSITMGGTDITATAYNNGAISIASVTGNLSITVTATAVTLSSISAVYTQSGTVYDTDSLDSLKADLVVTATWSDSSTTTVDSADYTLSGTLTVGTSTITVSYEGKTATFTVTVTQHSGEETLWINGYAAGNSTQAKAQYAPFYLTSNYYTYDYTKKIVAIEFNVHTAGKLSIGHESESYLSGNSSTARNNFVLDEEITFTQTGQQKVYLETPIQLSSGQCLAIGKSSDAAVFLYGTGSTDKGFKYCGASNVTANGTNGLGINVYVQ